MKTKFYILLSMICMFVFSCKEPINKSVADADESDVVNQIRIIMPDNSTEIVKNIVRVFT